METKRTFFYIHFNGEKLFFMHPLKFAALSPRVYVIHAVKILRKRHRYGPLKISGAFLIVIDEFFQLNIQY